MLYSDMIRTSKFHDNRNLHTRKWIKVARDQKSIWHRYV